MNIKKTMSREEAIRLLDPKTTRETLAEIEYYGGFSGDVACVAAIEDACMLAIEALTKQMSLTVAKRTVYDEYLQGWKKIRVCPVCGIDTPVPRALESWEQWCPDCGQRLTWSKPKGNDCDFMFIDEVIAYDTQKKD